MVIKTNPSSNSILFNKTQISMPVYLHLANLVFDKKKIEAKYKGGLNQFRTDFHIGESKVNQEDDELFLVGRMNASEFSIDELVEKGLSYSDNCSTDFVFISRYGGASWETDWFNCNAVFAWHLHCDKQQVNRAVEIGEKLTMDRIVELIDEGIDVFATIKTGSALNEKW